MNIRNLQKVQLQTLKDVRDFCDKNNICYFLYCGTLLGCIRHGGFVPWDDDVDLAMPLEDFKKFSKLVSDDKQFTQKYTVIGSYYDPAPDYPWMKISRKDTIFYDKQFLNNRLDKGISLDIYPLIGAYEGGFKRYMQEKALRLQKDLFLLELNKATDYVYVKDQTQVPKLKLLGKIPFRLRAFVIDRVRHLFWPDPGKCRFNGTVDSVEFAGKFPKEFWKNQIEAVFEQETFMIPERYHDILIRIYGYYTQLPPVEQRVNSHMHDPYLYIGKEAAEEVGIEL